MKRRKSRLPVIVDILTNNSIGSQEELAKQLAKRGFVVTQATLSRDLKMLKTTKVPTDMGGYRYIITGHDSTLSDQTGTQTIQSAMHPATLSIAITGNLVVIKTRNGYASGLAYDMDMLGSDHILGTISGADTVFVAVSPTATKSELFSLFSTMLPASVMAKAQSQFINEQTLS